MAVASTDSSENQGASDMRDDATLLDLYDAHILLDSFEQVDLSSHLSISLGLRDAIVKPRSFHCTSDGVIRIFDA